MRACRLPFPQAPGASEGQAAPPMRRHKAARNLAGMGAKPEFCESDALGGVTSALEPRGPDGASTGSFLIQPHGPADAGEVGQIGRIEPDRQKGSPDQGRGGP